MVVNSPRAKWKKGDIIRHKYTHHAYMVVHVYKQFCTLLHDMEASEAVTPTYTLLPKSYDEYVLNDEIQEEVFLEPEPYSRYMTL